MDNEAIRHFCLGLPYVTEKIQWGEDLVFKVGGKMFAVLNLSPGHARNRISFKSAPEEFAELVERDGIIPAPYMARAWWVALDSFNTMRAKELQDCLARAHQLIYEKLPKKLRQELEGSYKAPIRKQPGPLQQEQRPRKSSRTRREQRQEKEKLSTLITGT